MDDVRFDRLARALGQRLPRRGAVGLIAGLASGFGVMTVSLLPDEDAAAKKNRKNTHKGQFRCNGKWMDKCVGGQTLDDDACVCRCPQGQEFRPGCKRCLTTGFSGECCPSEKLCQGSCIPAAQCCPAFERECTRQVKQNGKTKTVRSCLPLGTCCPGEGACPIAEGGCCNALAGEECAAFEGCCNTVIGKTICEGKWCCDPGEQCCPGVGCRAEGASCCPVPCPSDPAGCCPDGQICTTLHGCCDAVNACLGAKCCTGGRQCTVGTNNGVPRAACCGGPERPEGEFGCDGICCVSDCGLCCAPDSQNPCLCC